MPKINVKKKGAKGELEWRDVLRSKGLTARRGQQYCGANGDPDVVCEELSAFHFEVKRTNKLQMKEALQQARTDAGDSKMPVVVHRPDYGNWTALVDAHAFLDIIIENARLKAMDFSKDTLGFEGGK